MRQVYKQWPEAELPGWGKASATRHLSAEGTTASIRGMQGPPLSQGAQPSGSAQTAQQLHTGFLRSLEKVHESISVWGCLGSQKHCPRDPEVLQVKRGAVLMSAPLSEEFSGKEV